MQKSNPADRADVSATGRRISFALGLAVIVAITSIATNRTDPVKTDASTPSRLSSDTTPQPIGEVGTTVVDREDEVRGTLARNPQRGRVSRSAPVFDRAARAELQESVRESMKMSVAKLGDEFAVPTED